LRKIKTDLLSHKKKLPSETRIVLALMNKQPRTVDDICKSAGIDRSTFYRVRPLLLEEGVIKRHEEGYVLYTFSELDDLVDEALKKFKNEGYTTISLDDIAVEVGRPPESIRESVYKLLKKYNLSLGEQSKLHPNPPMAKVARE